VLVKSYTVYLTV